jgi:hypothetical protein
MIHKEIPSLMKIKAGGRTNAKVGCFPQADERSHFLPEASLDAHNHALVFAIEFHSRACMGAAANAGTNQAHHRLLRRLDCVGVRDR